MKIGFLHMDWFRVLSVVAKNAVVVAAHSATELLICSHDVDGGVAAMTAYSCVSKIPQNVRTFMGIYESQ